MKSLQRPGHHTNPLQKNRRILLCLIAWALMLIALISGRLAMPLAAQSEVVSVWISAENGHILNDNTLNALRTSRAEVQLPLPLPDGSTITPTLIASPIFEAGFLAKHPDFRSFQLESTDNAQTHGRLLLLPDGLHAIIEHADKTILIDPVPASRGLHQSRYDSDHISANDYEELVIPADPSETTPLLTERAVLSTTRDLKTYRIAISTDGQWGQEQGGTVTSTLAAIATRLSDINFYLEAQTAIRLVLVSDNDKIVFTDAATDPFASDATRPDILEANQALLDTEIGHANYDIGHLFSAEFKHAVAHIGSVCGAKKGSAISYQGDSELALHEIAHQFGANHTFNGTAKSCAGGNVGISEYEPGSGNSVMSYATFCAPQNLGARENRFHLASLIEIESYIHLGGGASCGITGNTGNHKPVADPGTASIAIPANTPFELNGSASDPDGDGQPGSLLYNWQQYDLGPRGHPNQPTGNAPLFRWLPAGTSATRVFPAMESIVTGQQRMGELLPSYTRSLHMRLVTFDNATVPATDWAEMEINVIGEAGPFKLLSPNGGEQWPVGSSQVISWDSANTQLAPINCQQVNLDLSTDGGYSYPHTLAGGIANSGSHSVIVPNIINETARLRVACATHPDHFFFDISDSDFGIQAASTDSLAIAINPTSLSFCGVDEAAVMIQLNPVGALSGSQQLTLSSAATGLMISPASATLAATDSMMAEIDTTATTASGDWELLVSADSGYTATIDLTSAQTAPAAPQALQPFNYDNWTGTQPYFKWQALPDAVSYDIELSSDPLFASDTMRLMQLSGEMYRLSAEKALTPATTYYWRIRATNACGTGPWGSRHQFRTWQAELPESVSSSVALWLDGDDSNGDTLPDSTHYVPLPTWIDRANNARNAIANPAPWLGRVPGGGLGRIEIDGQHYGLTSTLSSLQAVTETAIFAVFAPTTHTSSTLLALSDSANKATRFEVGTFATANGLEIGVQASINGDGQFSTGMPLSAPMQLGNHWLMLGFSADSEGTPSRLYNSGHQLAGDTSAVSFSDIPGTNSATIAALATQTVTPTNNFSGNIGEILIFNRALTGPERQQVEGYLAHKWGMVAQLPVEHPWAALPPNSTLTQTLWVNPDSFSIDEYSPVGSPIGTATASLPGTTEFSIAAGDPDGILHIDSLNGTLSVADQSLLLASSVPTFYLTIEASQQISSVLGSNLTRSGSGLITVTVNDLNLPPIATVNPIAISTATENDSLIGSVIAFDLDISDTLTYVISDGNSAGIFALDPLSGTLSIADNASFGSFQTADFTLTIVVSDDGTPVQSATLPLPIHVSHCLTDNIVTVATDDGPCSLRGRIERAAPGATIYFAPQLTDATITLTTPLLITRALTVDGHKRKIVLNGDSNSDGLGEGPLVVINSGDDVALDDLIFQRGRAVNNSGGGLQKRGGGTLTLDGCTFVENLADLDGGAISVEAGALEVSNCTFERNSAENDGGAIYQCGTLSVERSLFLFNQSGDAGGAIHQQCNQPLNVVNNTFYHNRAGDWGGAIHGHHTTSITNSTFIKNSAYGGSDTGGAIGIRVPGILSLHNSILANSWFGGECRVGVGATLSANDNNLIKDGSCSNGTTNIENVDPMLGSLQSNGGQTRSMLPATLSPVLDNGNVTACPSADQRGFGRNNTTCDIGAIEFDTIPTAITLHHTTAQRPGNAVPLATTLLILITLPMLLRPSNQLKNA